MMANALGSGTVCAPPMVTIKLSLPQLGYHEIELILTPEPSTLNASKLSSIIACEFVIEFLV